MSGLGFTVKLLVSGLGFRFLGIGCQNERQSTFVTSILLLPRL